MLFSKKEGLEDILVRLLLDKPLQIKELHAKLILSDPISSRAVYKTVVSLMKAGVLIKVGKRVWVDHEWLKRLKEVVVPTLPLVSPGERVAFTFSSIEHLDAFWKTIMLQLGQYERDGYIFFYNPHNFWAYVPERKESEDAYYAHFLELKKHAYFTVGGITNADMEFKRTYQNDYLQVDARPISSLGRTNHITVLGDVVVTVRMPSSFSKYADEMYSSGQSSEVVLPAILEVLQQVSRVTVTVEHNGVKANKIRKILSPNFFFRG